MVLIYEAADSDTLIDEGDHRRCMEWLYAEALSSLPRMTRLPDRDCFWCGKEAVPVVHVVWGRLHANITVCGPCLARALRVVNEED